MRCLTTLLLTVALAFSGTFADEILDGAAHVKRLAPFVDGEVVAVVYVNLRQMDAEAFVNQIGKLTKDEQTEVSKSAFIKWIKGIEKAGGKDIYFILGLEELSRGPSVAIPLDKGANADAIREILVPAKRSEDSPMTFEVSERIGEAIFAGTKATLGRLKNMKPAENAELAKAFNSAGDAAIAVAIIASPNTRRAVDDTLATLPDWLGGGSPKVLTRGVRWASAAIETKPKMSLRIVVQSADAAAAKQVADWWTTVVKFAKDQKEIANVWPNLEQLAKALVPKVKGDRVTLALDDATLTAVVQPAAVKARTAARRAQDANSMKQTGLALHSYHDAAGNLPLAANYDKAGKPLLSWRVLLLPYLDQEELYKQFKLDEPWDSEHNKKLIPKMPAVYKSSPNLEPGKTTFLGVAGDKATFPGNKAVKIADFRDGTSNTIVVVDADEEKAVFWTQPEDYRYDPTQPGAGLTGRFDGKFAALFCDGSVRFISGKIDAKLLNLLFDRDDGQVIGEIP